MKYLVMHVSEDGEVYGDVNEKEELLKRLGEGYWGRGIKVATEIPKEGEIMQWGSDLIYILNAELVIPKPKSVVAEYIL